MRSGASSPVHLRVALGTPLSLDLFLSESGPWTLGSSLDCDIPIRGLGISRRHVEVRREKGELWFRDLKSTNGTFLDEMRASEGVLARGSVLRFGDALVRRVDTATERMPALSLPDHLSLMSLTSITPSRPSADLGLNRRQFTMDDVAHMVGTFLAEGKAGLEWAMLCGFLQESLGCQAVVCYEKVGDTFALKASDGTFPEEIIDPAMAQQAAALPAMGTFRLDTPRGLRHLVSIPVTYDHRKVCFLGVAKDGDNPLLHHQDALPVIFVLCRLVLRWAEELRQKDNAVGDLKAQIRQVEAGLIAQADGLEPIIGRSPQLLKAIETVGRVAPTSASVLLWGPEGAGKDLFARRIHRLSRRSGGPFVSIHCGAVPENLLESELFGVERGIGTGAEKGRAGFFEKANGGTLFLDEISGLPAGLQPKFLRVLEEKRVTPLGSVSSRPVDVRMVAATSQRPADLLADGCISEALYQRLSDVLIHVPALREREEDILLLADHFVQVANREFGRAVRGFEEGAVQALRRYDWPGNVRQIQALVKQLVLMSDGPVLGAALVEAVLARCRSEAGSHPAGGQ